jgi:predicted acetyltransferase
MIKYSNAVSDDVNSLKELWLQTFSEDKQQLDSFFEKLFSPEICFTAKSDGELVAMLYMLKTSVNGHNAGYLYAVATKAEFQGRGIISKLINYAIDNSNIELCITLPAEDSLYGFYEKLGFCNNSVNTATVSRSQLSSMAKPYKKDELVVSNYCGIRNRVLKNNFLFWNNNHINFAMDYESAYGAKVIKSNFGYAIVSMENDTAVVSEIICDDNNAPYLIFDILTNFNCNNFKFYLSQNQKFLTSDLQKYGMVKFLTDYKPQNIYIGLPLD